MALAHPDLTATAPLVVDWLEAWPAAEGPPDDDRLAVVPAAPSSWGQDSDNHLADENVELRHQVALLGAENKRLHHQLDAGLEALHAAMVGAFLNAHLKTEALVLVRAAVEVDRRWRKHPTADGWVRVPLEAIGSPTFAEEGEAAAPPLRHRTTVARHLKRGAAWGLIEHKVILEDVEEVVVDPKIATSRTRRHKNRATLLRRDADLVATLRRLAEFVRPEKSNHGGPRQCRRCGATARTTVVTCDECGERLVGPAPDPDAGNRRAHVASCSNKTVAAPRQGEGREVGVNSAAAAAVWGHTETPTPNGSGVASHALANQPPPPPRGQATPLFLRENPASQVCCSKMQHGVGQRGGQSARPLGVGVADKTTVHPRTDPPAA